MRLMKEYALKHIPPWRNMPSSIEGCILWVFKHSPEGRGIGESGKITDGMSPGR